MASRAQQTASATVAAPQRAWRVLQGGASSVRRPPVGPLPLSPALRAQQAVELRQRLAQHLSGHIELHITDNRAVMLSVKRDPRHKRYSVRLHHIFVGAPPSILRALGAYVGTNDGEASRELNTFIEANDHRIAPGEHVERRSVPRSEGKVFDLAVIFDDLNATYFDGTVTAAIGWGRRVKSGQPRSSVRLGSFVVEENLIRIHPGLDQTWIPLYYVQWVVYHEMLHAVHPIPVVDGRRCFHTPELKRDEARFEHYEQALRWEQRNVAALLSM